MTRLDHITKIVEELRGKLAHLSGGEVAGAYLLEGDAEPGSGEELDHMLGWLPRCRDECRDMMAGDDPERRYVVTRAYAAARLAVRARLFADLAAMGMP